jgi:hypothetical protein
MSLYDGNTTMDNFEQMLLAAKRAEVSTVLSVGPITVFTFGKPGTEEHEFQVDGKNFKWRTVARSARSISKTGNHSTFAAKIMNDDGDVTENRAVFGPGTLPKMTTSISQAPSVSQAPPRYQATGVFPPTDQFSEATTQQSTADQPRPLFQVRVLGALT